MIESADTASGDQVELTPTTALAAGLTRYASLFAKADPEDGLLLCLANGERPICRGVAAIGVKEYLRILQQRLAA